MPGRLTLCASPIGNLGDAPPRLREALASANVVFAEDTRHSAKLLAALGVDTPLQSYFVGNEEERARELAERLGRGEDVALLTDAGTPGVSDPGLSAVRAAVAAGAHVTVVPGASAVTAALAVSGFSGDRFVFEGFLPRRGKQRAARLSSVADEVRTVVLFSSPHRVAEDLLDLADVAGSRAAVIARELTKLYEEVWRGTLTEAAERWTEEKPQGEFTIVIEGGSGPTNNLGMALQAVQLEMEGGTRLSDAVRRVAEDTGVSRKELYEAALKKTGDSRQET